ncbi:MAG: DEAD/DEAH box helicase [Verrucomicrobia bacterium]|nr:DEAD/DEAH box helicase [Verrucomicrobiota bacterium]
MEGSPFSKKDLADGKALLEAGKVGQVLFSEGTYQVEASDLTKKGRYWPFLQLDDEGHVLDCFCSCPEAEKKKSCAHLAAAYQKIFNGHRAPLHMRFHDSLWNHLCQLASHRHGYDAQALKGKNQVYEAKSVTGKKLFSVKGLNPKGKKRLQEVLFKRTVETEETSLKFSNLPPEEIALWKEGRPSHELQYELSFWSDLSKWMMAMQEDKEKYLIQFEEGEKGLPHWIHVSFPSLSVSFYIAEVNWTQLIPALASVDSPLPVYEFQDYRIEAIRYDVKERALRIEKGPISSKTSARSEEALQGIEVGEWLFVPKKGFFPQRIDPIFKQDEIPQEKIGSVLHKHPLILQKYIVGAKLHVSPVKAQYHVQFDADENLHIACYVFEKGDLQKADSAYFGPWVYLQDKGFYLLDNLLFEGVEKIVPRAQMNDFINRHRVWLGGFEGFQTHVFAIESQLHFAVSKEGFLRFEASIEMMDSSEEVIDFGEWIYLKGKGFFAKKIGRGGSLIRPGETVHKAEIATFIRQHRDDLDGLKGFFSSRCPLEKSGLEIFLNEGGRIVVRPHFQFVAPYAAEQVQIFGEYTYVDGEGFYEIPYEKRVPEAYVKEKTISLTDEPYFVLYELDALKACIFSIQKELKKPRDLYLRVRKLQRSGRTKAAEWLLEGLFETEVGTVELFEVWQAVQENKRYLFSSAGLLLLKHPRFNWFKNIPKKRWLKGGKQLRMTTMEWLRLTVFEDLRPPLGTTVEENDTRLLIQKLTSFQTDQNVDLSGFKSDLRSYQEVGVRWLWFLYLHGLSGMLCDEMGLGKTHQAMGLIAAAQNQSRLSFKPSVKEVEELQPLEVDEGTEQSASKASGENSGKILVVCPTSVIYHWEDLLKNFLPAARVLVFYGISRKLASFEEKADILLTSYGTLRSEKQSLSQIDFEIAIFDELQIAKNAQSQTHKALKKIKASMRLGLTGTPIENRLLELKALFDVVVPGYLPQEAQFKELFVNPIEKNQDNEKKSLLSKLIKPFILRRKKSEVLLELPDKIEEIAYCDLSEEQDELYRKTFLLHKEALMQDLENKAKPVPYLHVFALLSSLKQICDHPCLITKQYSEFQKHKSGKWDLFVELLHEVRDSGQKLVVFSQYLDMLDMIEAYLKEHQIGYAGIRGSTRNRKEQLDTFKEDPKCEVFLASLQAVGVGVDLVSASVVIHYDRWWNPARENQATDRVHRIGQNRGVQVFKLVTKGTIEEHIHRLIEKKLTLMEGVIGFDDQDHIKGLDRDELLQLLWLINKDIEQDPGR